MLETRTRYTKEFKLEALQLWESSEKTATAIENDLGLAICCSQVAKHICARGSYRHNTKKHEVIFND